MTKFLEIPVSIKKLHPNAKIPIYGSAEAAGADLHSSEHARVEPGQSLMVPCGFAMELPVGYEAQVRPRSGLAYKHGIAVLNTPGTIDSDYRGEVKVLLFNHGSEPFDIEPGDRIAQMVIAPVFVAKFGLVEELNTSERGAGGFGSTGVKS